MTAARKRKGNFRFTDGKAEEARANTEVAWAKPIAAEWGWQSIKTWLRPCRSTAFHGTPKLIWVIAKVFSSLLKAKL